MSLFGILSKHFENQQLFISIQVNVQEISFIVLFRFFFIENYKTRKIKAFLLNKLYFTRYRAICLAIFSIVLLLLFVELLASFAVNNHKSLDRAGNVFMNTYFLCTDGIQCMGAYDGDLALWSQTVVQSEKMKKKSFNFKLRYARVRLREMQKNRKNHIFMKHALKRRCMFYKVSQTKKSLFHFAQFFSLLLCFWCDIWCVHVVIYFISFSLLLSNWRI